MAKTLKGKIAHNQHLCERPRSLTSWQSTTKPFVLASGTCCDLLASRNMAHKLLLCVNFATRARQRRTERARARLCAPARATKRGRAE